MNADQRLVYCGAFRARLSPYFFRSFIRGSRVRRPACRSGSRFASASTSRRARAIPWRIAPAWPVTPPPSTLIIALKWPSVPVTRNGIRTSASLTALPKCSSSVRPFTTISPSPGRRRTRAIAVLRRPVPEKKAGVVIDGSSSGERLRPLGLMRMVGTGVDLELPELLDPETGSRQHPLHGAADDFLGPTLQEMTEGLLLQALRMAAMPDVQLRFLLVACHGDPGRVQDDHVVAGVEVRRPGRLVLALEHARNARRETSERLVRRIHDVPAPLDLALADRVGLRAHASRVVSVALVPLLDRPIATRRSDSPLAGAIAPFRAGVRAASASRTCRSVIVPRPTSRRTATIRRTMPRRKASARTSIVTVDPRLRTRTA